MLVRALVFLAVSLICSSASASTTVNATVVRNEAGSGTCLISSGFPLPPGVATESNVTGRTIRVLVDGSEVAANVTALRGRHRDGSLRSVLIQFSASLAQNATLDAQVVIGDGARTLADPAYVRPTLAIVAANNVIVATDPTYLCSTFVTFQNLLPVGNGTAAEEKQYTTLAENRFDALAISQYFGSASYENPRGMIALWQRSGKYKFHGEAIRQTLDWLPYNTLSDTCVSYDLVNPDGRTSTNACGIPAEWHSARMLTYATAYLLTGYRDFWSFTSYILQRQQTTLSTQNLANTRMLSYYNLRFSYGGAYSTLIPAYHIAATMPLDGDWNSGRQMDFSDQIDFTIGSLDYNKWDMLWIPFTNGTGAVPEYGTVISQGGVSAVFQAVGEQRGFVFNSTMPASGFIQVKKSSLTGGDFAAGALSGINATATGPTEDDFRNGYIGMYSYRTESQEECPLFQSIFPMNFLIDTYLYIYADERIPALVENALSVVLKSINSHDPIDQGEWGVLEYEHPYNLENPIATTDKNPWILPEYARMLAFLIKTVGDKTVNGKTYSQWYEICINTANNAPTHLSWQWKLFGQYYGMSQDAPWIMAQETLSGPSTFVEPTQYSAIPDYGVQPIDPDDPVDPGDDDPTPTTSGPILRIGDSLLRVGDGVLRVQ